METMGMSLVNFYQGKTVLVTGHTGFKGSWICETLHLLGANVVGYALQPNDKNNLYDLLQLDQKLQSHLAPMQDFKRLNKVFQEVQPEIVFHMAAQPLVRESYKNPVYTYETNVMGTVHLMECVRLNSCVRSVVNITTDKVYENKEWQRGYREEDRLNGYDPYSNSKSCSELVTDAYRKSFFSQRENLSVSTVRSGNVIGGGDFAKDRIIPDCFRAVQNQEKIILRSPYSVRPYQHVLEPIFVYLRLAELQHRNQVYAGAYNVGPNDSDCLQTKELVQAFCDQWNDLNDVSLVWEVTKEANPLHEANLLRLDCDKIKKVLNWHPVWEIQVGMKKTVEWYDAYRKNQDMCKFTTRQILEYVENMKYGK